MSNESGTLTVSNIELIGGGLFIEPGYQLFRNCYFRGVDIRMSKVSEHIFFNCYCEACIFDENTLASLRYGGNIVRPQAEAPEQAA